MRLLDHSIWSNYNLIMNLHNSEQVFSQSFDNLKFYIQKFEKSLLQQKNRVVNIVIVNGLLRSGNRFLHKDCAKRFVLKIKANT